MFGCVSTGGNDSFPKLSPFKESSHLDVSVLITRGKDILINLKPWSVEMGALLNVFPSSVQFGVLCSEKTGSRKVSALAKGFGIHTD